MSQESTLQDLYSKIADIYDKFCELDTAPTTKLQSEITIDPNSWTSSQIYFDNPDNNQFINDAQSDINSLLGLAMQVAQDNSSVYGASITDNNGQLVPISKGSPITLLPKLIKLLVDFRSPLNLIVGIVIDFIEDTLLDHIKQKLREKNGNFYEVADVAKTTIIKIPRDAEKMIIAFNNLPEYLGKRFQGTDLNIDIIQPAPSITPDLSKFLLDGLGTVNFGLSLTGSNVSATAFWGTDINLKYRRQIFDIPTFEDFTNYQRYAYLYLNNENTCTAGFFRRTSVS